MSNPEMSARGGDGRRGVFLNEDLSHPENRINVALFGLMTQDWFRKWFLEKLGLQTDAIIYPPTNENGVRPDLKIDTTDGETLAWVEVELGTDPAQVATYRGRLSEPVKTVYGKRKHGGDLSLEEIADHLSIPRNMSAQTEVNVQHLRDQIRQALSEFSSSPSVRAEVSEAMREHPLVAGLVSRLGGKLQFTTGAVPIGCLKADTTGPQGFSLRVNSRQSSSGTLSVLAISGGRPTVRFPSRKKLERYLPAHRREIEAYASLLERLGCDIGLYGETQRPSLPVQVVIDALDEISACVLQLGDCSA